MDQVHLLTVPLLHGGRGVELKDEKQRREWMQTGTRDRRGETYAEQRRTGYVERVPEALVLPSSVVRIQMGEGDRARRLDRKDGVSATKGDERR